MLRALRRHCGGPTLRILVIGVDGAEPTPSVHPGGEPEEPTGVPAYFWYDMRRASASSYPLRFSGKSSDIRAKNIEPYLFRPAVATSPFSQCLAGSWPGRGVPDSPPCPR